MGEERREWRRASRAKETDMAGARVIEPQGEGGREAMKVAEEEVRGGMDERGRGTCEKCYGFVFADVMRCGGCIGVAGMWRQGAHFEYCCSLREGTPAGLTRYCLSDGEGEAVDATAGRRA